MITRQGNKVEIGGPKSWCIVKGMVYEDESVTSSEKEEDYRRDNLQPVHNVVIAADI